MAEFSPMMQHYLQTKEEYKDCILFYRLGDFYEMFFDDAVNVSQELELTLTGKDCGQEQRRYRYQTEVWQFPVAHRMVCARGNTGREPGTWQQRRLPAGYV